MEEVRKKRRKEEIGRREREEEENGRSKEEGEKEVCLVGWFLNVLVSY